MSLDRRLAEEFRRSGAEAPTVVERDTLALVAARAEAVHHARRSAFAAGLAVALVLAGGLALQGLVAPHRDASPVPVPPASAPLTRTFVSPVHGYTMSYPQSWTVVPATRPWRHGTDGGDIAVVDRFESPGRPVVDVASQPLPPGWTDAQWFADFLPSPGDVAEPQCFPPRAQWESLTIDGHAAGWHGGDFGCSFTQAVVIVDHRAYVFTAMPDPTAVSTAVFDAGLLRDMLASVRLHPQDALP
jgi:hypothetical protein